MVNFDDFKLTLAKPLPVYSPGDNIKGLFQFTISERIKINNISIKFDGKAQSIWYF
jgi:hypothetical protein